MLCEECQRELRRDSGDLSARQQWLLILLIILAFALVFGVGVAMQGLYTY